MCGKAVHSAAEERRLSFVPPEHEAMQAEYEEGFGNGCFANAARLRKAGGVVVPFTREVNLNFRSRPPYGYIGHGAGMIKPFVTLLRANNDPRKRNQRSLYLGQKIRCRKGSTP